MLPLAHSWGAAPSPSRELGGGGKLGELVLAQLPAGSSPGSLQPAMDACLSLDPQPKPLEWSLAELVPSISGELKEVLWSKGESIMSWVNCAFQISMPPRIGAFQVGIPSVPLAISALPGQHPPWHQCLPGQHLPEYWCLPGQQILLGISQHPPGDSRCRHGPGTFSTLPPPDPSAER